MTITPPPAWPPKSWTPCCRSCATITAILPASTNSAARPASEVEEARAKVAALLNADPKEIVFTSCGTESNNAALHSALATHPGQRHILTTAVEHSAIINHCAFLQKQGCEVTFLPVDADGSLDLHLLDKSIRPDTALVSVMWANNETGVVFPIEEIAAICHSKNVLFHTDATQVPGKMKMDVKALDADLLTLSAHKLHAPKGVGLLYVKRRTKFQPYLLGGHQERGRRAGTENVAAIVAFGRAAELALANFQDENTRVRALRDRMENAILTGIPNTIRNGAQEPRLPNTSNIAFDFVEARGHPAVARPDRRLRFQRLRLHDRLAGTFPCPDRDGRQPRPGARLHPFQPGNLQHGRGSGSSLATPSADHQKAARDFPRRCPSPHCRRPSPGTWPDWFSPE